MRKLFSRGSKTSFNYLLVVALVLFAIILIGSLKPSFTSGACTLEDFEKIASRLDEFGEWDYHSLLNPSYENIFREKFRRTRFNKLTNNLHFLLHKVGILPAPPMSYSYMIRLLEKTLVTHKAYSLNADVFAGGILLNKRSKIIVFGRCHSSFHLLTRCLRKLLTQGLIDENLKLTNPDTYLVVLGGYLHRSQFDLESLQLFATLVLQNPSNVILLRGRNEVRDFWMENTLGRTLYLYAKQHKENPTKLYDLANDFMMQHPNQLYGFIPTEGDNIDFIRFSSIMDPHPADEASRINPSSIFPTCGEKLRFASTTPEQLNRQTPQTFSRKAEFRDVSWRDQYQLNDGLILLSSYKGCAEWTLITSYTEVCRKALNFHFESFAVVSCDQWPLSWHLRFSTENLLTKEANFKIFDLFSGERLR